MRAPLVGAAILLGTGLAACGGGSGHDARTRVSDYVHRANAVQRRYQAQFAQADKAYVAFAKGHLGNRTAVVRLGAAQRAIAAARRDIAALPAPAEARGLRARLLRYLDMNEGFARQTTRLAAYQRRSPQLLAPIGRANARLRAGLRSTSATEQAAALGAFAGTLHRALHAMHALAVPAVLRPAHDAQLRRLKTTRSLAERLRAALLAHDAPGVARLLLRFRHTATATGPSSRAVARAIDAYNRRFHLLTRAYADVRREQARLDRSLR